MTELARLVVIVTVFPAFFLGTTWVLRHPNEQTPQPVTCMNPEPKEFPLATPDPKTKPIPVSKNDKAIPYLTEDGRIPLAKVGKQNFGLYWITVQGDPSPSTVDVGGSKVKTNGSTGFVSSFVY